MLDVSKLPFLLDVLNSPHVWLLSALMMGTFGRNGIPLPSVKFCKARNVRMHLSI